MRQLHRKKQQNKLLAQRTLEMNGVCKTKGKKTHTKKNKKLSIVFQLIKLFPIDKWVKNSKTTVHNTGINQ